MHTFKVALSLLAVGSVALAEPLESPALAVPTPHAPPAPPPILQSDQPRPLVAALPLAAAATGTEYSIGTPTDTEQYYLELINRARANPTAEGARLAATTDPDVLGAYSYFSVDLALMQSEFAALPVRPPLAFNEFLTDAARGHSADLYTHAFQGHVGTDGRTLGQRATDAGYVWNSIGENVFSYAVSPWQGHAGFQVDWGTGSTGGMQPGRGHRANIHGNFREIGIGVVNGTNTVGTKTVGPQLVTQDFGSSTRNFVTGVAYYDFDGDGVYSPGEGIGGLTVEVEGSDYYAVTAPSGGYAVPVPATAANRAVGFDGLGCTYATTVSVPANSNAKVDYVPTYQPPAITGPTAPYLGRTSTYTFTAVGGATAYSWQRARKVATAADPADNLARVNATVSGTYSPSSAGVKFSGTASYHLAHPTTATQTLTYPDTLFVGPAGNLSFYSRLGWATSTQIARVEVSTDSEHWTTVYSQAGTTSAGETTFTQRAANLAAYAGRTIQIRFSYSASGSYYNGTNNGVGWYIDQIAFTDLFTATGTSSGAPTGLSFGFTPTTTETYLLSVRPVISGRSWRPGPILEVTPVTLPPFAQWAIQQETAAGLAAGTIEAHPYDDYNADGLANLTAYALGLSATTASSAPTASVSEGHLRLRYNRDIAQTDIIVTPQISTDLETWHDLGAAAAPAGFSAQTLSAVGTVQTREVSVPVDSGARLFLRLQITQP